MKKAKAKPVLKPILKPVPTTDAATSERLNRRSRRRIIRTMIGAVVGGVIAGPLGAVVGTAVGATSRRVPGSRTAKAGPPKSKQKLRAKPAAASKSGAKRPVRKKMKPSINAYPNLP